MFANFSRKENAHATESLLAGGAHVGVSGGGRWAAQTAAISGSLKVGQAPGPESMKSAAKRIAKEIAVPYTYMDSQTRLGRPNAPEHSGHFP